MDLKNCCSSYHAQFLSCDRYKIMKLSWLEDPNARPSFSDLTIQLKKMENQHKVHVRFKQETSWTILSLSQLSSFTFVHLHQQVWRYKPRVALQVLSLKRSRYASLAVNCDLSPCLFLITKVKKIELLTGWIVFLPVLRKQADCKTSMIRLRT